MSLDEFTGGKELGQCRDAFGPKPEEGGVEGSSRPKMRYRSQVLRGLVLLLNRKCLKTRMVSRRTSQACRSLSKFAEREQAGRRCTLGSEGPRTWTLSTWSSWDCPAPFEGTQDPVRRMAAPRARLCRDDLSASRVTARDKAFGRMIRTLEPGSWERGPAEKQGMSRLQGRRRIAISWTALSGRSH